jgi:methyl-accepting chemotaxis protein
MTQIHQAMRNIGQVSQQNAAATQQVAQAAANLNKLGTRLAALTAA